MLDSRNCPIGVLAIIFLGLCIAGANARAPSRIIGGTDAAPGEFPWQVSLRAYDTHLCGGTIIGKRHVLTAGHCIVGVTEAPYSEMTVVTGSYIQRPGTGKAYRVQDIVVHKQYVARTERSAVKNDIAVITVRKDIEENEFQRPIPLPTGDIPNGVTGTVTGFGWTNFEDRSSSNILKKLNVVLMNGGNCLERGIRIQKSQICGVNPVGQGHCRGDSGGPLVYNGAIVGVVSTAMHPCGFGIPDVYTKVYHYLDFINKAMATAS